MSAPRSAPISRDFQTHTAIHADPPLSCRVSLVPKKTSARPQKMSYELRSQKTRKLWPSQKQCGPEARFVLTPFPQLKYEPSPVKTSQSAARPPTSHLLVHISKIKRWISAGVEVFKVNKNPTDEWRKPRRRNNCRERKPWLRAQEMDHSV